MEWRGAEVVQEFCPLYANIRTEGNNEATSVWTLFVDKAQEKLALLIINTCIKKGL